MRVFIGLATGNAFLRQEFLKLRNKITAPSNFPGGALTLELGAPDLSRGPNLERYFYDKSSTSDALLVIGDDRCGAWLEFTRTALFIHRVGIPSRVENAESYLVQKINRLLSTFSAFCIEVLNGQNQQASLLPERNFDAAEWRDLIELVRLRTHALSFVEETKALFSQLKQRRKPRRKSSYSTRYFIDDDDKHFEYGTEHHSLPATGAPHALSCELNFTFRFGRRVADIQRHFNVTRGPGKNPSIKGSFPNCHCEWRDVTKTTHLNMFMNDYY